MNFEEIATKVIEWGYAKGIIDNTKEQVKAQLGKVQEELDELSVAVEYDEPLDAKKLELGDLYVTILMVSTCLSITPAEALEAAYNKISKRTGKVIDGVFVKDD